MDQSPYELKFSFRRSEKNIIARAKQGLASDRYRIEKTFRAFLPDVVIEAERIFKKPKAGNSMAYVKIGLENAEVYLDNDYDTDLETLDDFLAAITIEIEMRLADIAKHKMKREDRQRNEDAEKRQQSNTATILNMVKTIRKANPDKKWTVVAENVWRYNVAVDDGGKILVLCNCATAIDAQAICDTLNEGV